MCQRAILLDGRLSSRHRGTVVASNPPPPSNDVITVYDDPANDRAGHVVTGNVLTNDTDSASLPLTVAAISGGTVGQDVHGTYGDLLMNKDGSFTYTAESTVSVTGLQPQDEFNFTVTDSNGVSQQESLVVSIPETSHFQMGTANTELDGTSYNDMLNGGKGGEHVYGYAGNDVLIGGPNDVLTGGKGADTFVFSGLDFGKNTITDFHPAQNDVMQLPKADFPDYATVLANAQNNATLTAVLITDPLHSQDLVQINNMTVSQLTQHDFHLV